MDLAETFIVSDEIMRFYQNGVTTVTAVSRNIPVSRSTIQGYLDGLPPSMGRTDHRCDGMCNDVVSFIDIVTFLFWSTGMWRCQRNCIDFIHIATMNKCYSGDTPKKNIFVCHTVSWKTPGSWLCKISKHIHTQQLLTDSIQSYMVYDWGGANHKKEDTK